MALIEIETTEEWGEIEKCRDFLWERQFVVLKLTVHIEIRHKLLITLSLIELHSHLYFALKLSIEPIIIVLNETII